MKETKRFIYISNALITNEKSELLFGKTAEKKWLLIGGTSEATELDTRQTMEREFSQEIAGASIHNVHLWRRLLREHTFIDYYAAELCWTNAERRLTARNGALVDFRFMSKKGIESLQPSKFRSDQQTIALEYLSSLQHKRRTS